MPTITHGVLLEPRTSSAELQEGVQARVHDPLWMLARQWQSGEFQASDSGSPVKAALKFEAAPLTRYRPDGTPGAPARPLKGMVPLEALVEREQVPEVNARHQGLLVEAGLQFLRLLTAYGVGRHRALYLKTYPRPAPTAGQRQEWDRDSLRFLELMAGRVPDAARLYKDLSAVLGPRGDRPGNLPAKPPIRVPDRPMVLQAARAWLQWFETQGLGAPAEPPATPSPWIPQRMEYAFAVAGHLSSGEVVLAAPEYQEGHLDWHSFVIEEGASLGASPASRTETREVLPAPVSFRGMPASRFWEMEDAQINLAAVEADERDPARLLLLEFALVYGSGWFVIPVEVDVGSLCQVVELTVADTFGIRTRVPHYAEVDGAASPWRMFSLARRSGGAGDVRSASLFFLPPALGSSLKSEPIEEVLFLRDEMANMAWAVERVVEAPTGRPLDRYEAFQEAEQRRNGGTQDRPVQDPAALVYRLGSRVPDYWIPLIPEQQPGSTQVRLRRGAMPRFGPDGRPQGTLPPRGNLLMPGRELALFGEEVPREGARVTRAFQYARWIDGSTHVWIGRRKQAGRGEGSSGLRFDVVE